MNSLKEVATECAKELAMHGDHIPLIANIIERFLESGKLVTMEKVSEEINAVLNHMPEDCVVRVCEGNGPENIFASLAVSVANLRAKVPKTCPVCATESSPPTVFDD